MARVGKSFATQKRGATAAAPAPQSDEAKLRTAFPSMYDRK